MIKSHYKLDQFRTFADNEALNARRDRNWDNDTCTFSGKYRLTLRW